MDYEGPLEVHMQPLTEDVIFIWKNNKNESRLSVAFIQTVPLINKVN